MFTKPESGWADFTIGDFTDRASYLHDIPFDVLNAIIDSVMTWQPIIFKLDAEGWENIIVIDNYDTHIINDKNESGFQLISIVIKKNDLISEIINSINSNIDEWASWGYKDRNSKNIVDRKEMLLMKISEIKRLYNII